MHHGHRSRYLTLGVAILRGEDLIWYGVKTFEDGQTLPHQRKMARVYLTRILKSYQPTVLAIEDPFYAQSLLSNNLRRLTNDIKTWGKWKGLRVCSYVPPEIKAFFCRDQKTKQSLDEAMIAKYPFLARYCQGRMNFPHFAG